MSLDADVLKVLADPLRSKILELLSGEALCTCHLVEETGAKQTNVSNHLKVLREAGFVDTEPCGRFTYYRLRPDALRRIAGSLTELADRADPDARRPC
ncbi:ArsR/SmtB family transcription factor [Lentzea jiangxiensis]|uniref:DNA-binding transcriptional regulator, ArsR family n=1 Tax=Lentzea jiangxiensis TaxID=641025 RepID=A0A1H0WHP6_9PSEU|nr:metalloregulator ArsR/SmtB family transcription factor [Lentzea jiangxiensis]SDP90299.1 DNA-binding transcriptional regulator, ArsR family [Lentzea jiangxiensis]